MTYQLYDISQVFNIDTGGQSVTLESFSDTTNPFIPKITPDYFFRKDLIRNIRAFLISPSGDALYITGPTGSGKTSVITEIAGRINWPVQQITAHGRLEMGDLIGYHSLVSSVPGDIPSMKFVYGPLPIAMKEGHILLINEIDLAEPSELAGLNDVLEGRPLVITQNGGEIIKPHPMFRVVVTGNTNGAGDMSGLYQGVMMQNMASMDRYRFIKVDYMDADTEETLLQKITPNIPAQLISNMVKVANEVRQLFLGKNGDVGKISLTMSTRTLVRWAKLTISFRGADNSFAYALDQALLLRANDSERTAILRIAKDIFGEQWGEDGETK